jgi:hypothetical protein
MGFDLLSIFNIARRVEAKMPSSSSPRIGQPPSDSNNKELVIPSEDNSNMEASSSPAVDHYPSTLHDETKDTPLVSNVERSNPQTVLLMAALCVCTNFSHRCLRMAKLTFVSDVHLPGRS